MNRKNTTFMLGMGSILLPLSLSGIINNKDFFSYIYRKNAWEGQESRSGHGSSPDQTKTARILIPLLLKKLNIKTLLDAPCGDFYWMKKVDLSLLDRYIGVDIVDQMITENNAHYSNIKRSFKAADITTDSLPRVNLIFCRDCLQHLYNEDVFKVINNFKKSGSVLLLVSNHPNIKENSDFEQEDTDSVLRTKQRNFMLPPFNFPKPLVQIEEESEGKYLTLWKIADLPSYQK